MGQGLQCLAEVNREHAFADAVRKAAQIELEVRDDFDTCVRVYKGTRHVLNPVWISMNYAFSQLETIPEGYIYKDIHEKILEPLFQPILDLPWEDYLWPEEEEDPLIAWSKKYLMTADEVRTNYGITGVPT